MNPYQVVKDFEAALCDYTGAPFAVTVMSCTDAVKLSVAWFMKDLAPAMTSGGYAAFGREIEIPKHTYVSVPMSIIHAGGRPTFRDEEWSGTYQLKPLPVWDSARLLTSGMYQSGQMQCISFHWSKHLGIQQGGAILHDDQEADNWLRKARFDGRTEGVAPKDDVFDVLGYHCYLSPEIAAEGLVRLSLLPKHNDPLPNDQYPDLSLIPLFN